MSTGFAETTTDRPALGFVAWNGTTVATLLGVDSWRVTVDGEDDREMARDLAALYANSYRGPADGYYGQDILIALAKLMGGVWWFHQPAPSGPGVIH